MRTGPCTVYRRTYKSTHFIRKTPNKETTNTRSTIWEVTCIIMDKCKNRLRDFTLESNGSGQIQVRYFLNTEINLRVLKCCDVPHCYLRSFLHHDVKLPIRNAYANTAQRMQVMRINGII
jgi:hypothetical protein